MIRKQDAYGRETKEADTPEDYLLLEIERLKEENARLKEELRMEKENKIERFLIAFNEEKETEYKVRLNGKKICVEKMEANNE